MMFIGGGVGGVGRIGGARRAAIGAPDFTLSNNSVTTNWGDAALIGELIPSNAPAGVTFRLVNETTGLAVVNG